MLPPTSAPEQLPERGIPRAYVLLCFWEKGPREAWPSSKHLCWTRWDAGERTSKPPASIQQPCPSRVDLSSPASLSPPPTTHAASRVPFHPVSTCNRSLLVLLNVMWDFYYSESLVVRFPSPIPPSRALQVVVGGGHQWGCPEVQAGLLLVCDGGGEQSR